MTDAPPPPLPSPPSMANAEQLAASHQTQPVAPTSDGAGTPCVQASTRAFRRRCVLPASVWDSVLLWSVLSLGGYIGTLVRFGFQYYKAPPKSEAAFTVMYAQLVGCYVMGVISEHQALLTSATGPRLHRLLYTFVATGTSFNSKFRVACAVDRSERRGFQADRVSAG